MTAPRVPEYLTTHVLAGERLVFALDREAGELTRGLAGHGRRGVTLSKQPPLTLVLLAMEAGNALVEHATAGATSILVIRGDVHVLVGGNEEVRLLDHQLLVLADGVRHDVRAETESLLLITVAMSDRPKA